MNAEQRLAILSSKNLRKDEASFGKESVVGRDGGSFRERSELRVDQSCRGLSLLREIMVR